MEDGSKARWRGVPADDFQRGLGQEDYEFVLGFLEVLTENYGAGMNPMDSVGGLDQSRLMTNGWVSDQTEGAIEDLLPSRIIDELTRLVMTRNIPLNDLYYIIDWHGLHATGRELEELVIALQCSSKRRHQIHHESPMYEAND